jgi:hypothetical protein
MSPDVNTVVLWVVPEGDGHNMRLAGRPDRGQTFGPLRLKVSDLHRSEPAHGAPLCRTAVTVHPCRLPRAHLWKSTSVRDGDSPRTWRQSRPVLRLLTSGACNCTKEVL